VRNLDRTPAVIFHPIQVPPQIVVTLVYLDEAYEERVREGRTATTHDLYQAIMEGAVQPVGRRE
jgi:hypothetical protein